MVWDSAEANAGFSDAEKTWLPVKEPQAARSVADLQQSNDSSLQHWKSALAFRKARPELMRGKTKFFDLPEPILGFERQTEEGALACLYNLSPEPQTLRLTGGTQTGPSAGVALDDESLTLGPNGFAYFEASASNAITIVAGE